MLEQRLRAVPGVLACSVVDDDVHVLVGPEIEPRRVAAAVGLLLPASASLHVVSPRRRPLRGATELVRDFVPVFTAVSVATLLVGGGSAVLARAFERAQPATGPGVVAETRAVEASVRTVKAAPERIEVLGTVVEVSPP